MTGSDEPAVQCSSWMGQVDMISDQQGFGSVSKLEKGWGKKPPGLPTTPVPAVSAKNCIGWPPRSPSIPGLPNPNVLLARTMHLDGPGRYDGCATIHYSSILPFCFSKREGWESSFSPKAPYILGSVGTLISQTPPALQDNAVGWAG